MLLLLLLLSLVPRPPGDAGKQHQARLCTSPMKFCSRATMPSAAMSRITTEPSAPPTATCDSANAL